MAENRTSRSSPSPWQAVLWFLDAALVAAMLGLASLWICGSLEFSEGDEPGYTISWGLGPVVIVAVAAVLRYALGCVLRRRSGPGTGAVAGLFGFRAVRKGVMALVTVFGFFAILEGLLTLVGFQAPLSPILVRGLAYQDQHNDDEAIVPDRDLLWRFKPGGIMHSQKINSLGFPEREVDPRHRPGTMRVICMGDSCTADGAPPYPTLLNELLEQSPPTRADWEAFHTAVHGYSVLQGLALYRKTTRSLDPDVVTLYFGWNDHWNAGHADRVRLLSVRKSLGAQALHGLREKRFFQFMAYLLRPLLPRPVQSGGEQVRVPPDEYRAGLTRLVREIQQSGAVPLLLTAPRAPQLPKALAEQGHGPSLEVIYERHGLYAQITREVAAECNAPLLDLAAMFANDRQCARWFYEDGIHFNEEGRHRVARAIHKRLVELPRSPSALRK